MLNAPKDRRADDDLLRTVSRSVFWNATLLPIATLASLTVSILIRRSFGLQSGVYDVLLGVANTLMFFSGLGLATTLPKFLPELQVKGGGQGVTSFVGRIGAVRFVALLAVLMPLGVYAEPVAGRLALGANGATYLRALTLLLLGRTALDLSYRGLEACFLQVRVNILTLLHSALDVCLVGTALAIGWSMGGVIWALGASAAGVALVGASTLRTRVREIDRKPASAPRSRILPTRIWRFAGLTYGRDLGLYFATPAFAGPVLAAALGSPEPVALFATGFFVASSTVTLLVSGFRGVFRPLFARIRAGGDEAQLRRAFDLVTKSQILAVVPAGAGLWVMVGDYLPLFYGHPFIAATPVARLFIVLLFAETTFSLGLLVLWMDERYLPVLAAQGVIVGSAIFFLWAARDGALLPAAAVLGGARLLAACLGYVAAQRRYHVRYPWGFLGRIIGVAAVMATVLASLRQVWETSAVEATTLTGVGVVLVALGLRVARVVGPSDLQVLERSSIPGRQWLVRWLSSSTAT